MFNRHEGVLVGALIREVGRRFGLLALLFLICLLCFASFAFNEESETWRGWMHPSSLMLGLFNPHKEALVGEDGRRSLLFRFACLLAYKRATKKQKRGGCQSHPLVPQATPEPTIPPHLTSLHIHIHHLSPSIRPAYQPRP